MKARNKGLYTKSSLFFILNEDNFYHIILPIILVFFVISLIYVANVYGFDYINAGYGIWDYPPKVCLRVPETQLWYTLKALDEWRNSWESNNGNKYLNFKLASMNKFSQLGCDIQIVDGNPVTIGASKLAIGVTICNNKGNNFFLNCIIVMPFEHEQYYSTSQHELGHALGLGHRLPFNNTGFMGVMLSKDIMNAQDGGWSSITNEDINAIKQIYNNDGFLNPEKVFS